MLIKSKWSVAAALVAASAVFGVHEAKAASMDLLGDITNAANAPSGDYIFVPDDPTEPDGPGVWYNPKAVRATVDCVTSEEGFSALTSCSGIETWAPDEFTENSTTYEYPTLPTVLDPNSFKAFTGPYAENDTGFSDLFDAQNASSDIGAFLDAITETMWPETEIMKFECGVDNACGGNSEHVFLENISAEYIVWKIGNDPNVTITKNNTLFDMDWTFKKAEGGTGAGLSGYWLVGSVCDTPPCLPPVIVDVPEVTATGSVAALGSAFALMSLVMERRRRRRTV